MWSLHSMTRRLLTNASSRDPREWALDLAANQPGFVQCSSRRDPSNTRSAPRGCAAIEVQTLAPYTPSLWGITVRDIASGDYRKSAVYREVKAIVTEGLLRRMEQIYPGASANVVWSELGSPATQERYTHTTQGNAFGLELRPTQFAALRPRATTPIAGLFLAGTSTAWGPATEGAMLSGPHAASAVLGRDLDAEVRGGGVIADRARLRPWPNDFDPLAACRGRGRKGTPATGEDEDAGAAPIEL